MLVFRLLRTILNFYVKQGRNVAAMGVTFGMESSMPNFTSIGARVGFGKFY